jgi:ubiquinone biosynthesis protein UbiJ
MTPQQTLTVAIHHGSAYGRDNLRDTDLTRLADGWPDLRAVFEEVQFLRDRVEHLQDEVDRLDCDVDVG